MVHNDHQAYAGITWGPEFIYVLASDADGISRGLVFDDYLRLVRDVPLPEIETPHQCAYRDGYVFIANTGHNRVTVWDRWDKCWTAYFVGHERVPEDKSTDVHINSVWYDDSRFYVVEHRHGPSRVRLFNHDWQEAGVWDIGREAHNVVVRDGMLYVCNSAHEGVTVRDLATGEDTFVDVDYDAGWVSQPLDKFIRHTYTRGLALTRERLYIGCSAMTPRGDRVKGQSAIAVFDSDLSYQDKIVLEDTGGLGDIRVAGTKDFAHNGYRCPWAGSE